MNPVTYFCGVVLQAKEPVTSNAARNQKRTEELSQGRAVRKVGKKSVSAGILEKEVLFSLILLCEPCAFARAVLLKRMPHSSRVCRAQLYSVGRDLQNSYNEPNAAPCAVLT